MAYLYSFCKFFEVLPCIIVIRKRTKVLGFQQITDMRLLVDQINLRRAEAGAFLIVNIASIAAFIAGVNRCQIVVWETVLPQQVSLLFGEFSEALPQFWQCSIVSI